MTARAPAPLPRRHFVGRLLAAFAGGAVLGRVRPVQAAPQGGEPYVGEIRMFGGNFAPQGWALCQGQALPIAENDTLFQLIGTTYGGDGKTTFNLPDLQGRAPMHWGQGPGGSNFSIGEFSGTEDVTLTVPQLPAHSHAAGCSSALGSSDSPAGRVPARNAAGAPEYGASANTDLGPTALLPSGGSQPHNNLQPYLGVSFIIALFGTFPSQS